VIDEVGRLTLAQAEVVAAALAIAEADPGFEHCRFCGKSTCGPTVAPTSSLYADPEPSPPLLAAWSARSSSSDWAALTHAPPPAGEAGP